MCVCFVGMFVLICTLIFFAAALHLVLLFVLGFQTIKEGVLVFIVSIIVITEGLMIISLSLSLSLLTVVYSLFSLFLLFHFLEFFYGPVLLYQTIHASV